MVEDNTPEDDEDIDTPEGEDAEGAEGEESSGGKKKLIMIIGGVIVLLTVVGGGLFATGMLDGLLGKDTAAEHAEGEDGAHGEEHADKKEDHAKKDKKGKDKGGHGEDGEGHESGFVEIPTMIVNLNTDDNDVPRYLRLTVQLELEDPSTRTDVEAIIPRVIDQFQTYLRELHIRDLKGSAGIYRLQMELLWRVNQAAAPAKVKDILFQEVLIQ